MARTPVDKHCRHCECRLPIFRVVFREKFCTKEHEREYRELIEYLGLERLKNAAERIRLATGREPAGAPDSPTVS